MACKGCPGIESLRTPVPANPMQFGAEAAFNLDFKVAGIPMVLPDGTIEFSGGEPPEIDGYVRDPVNLRLFHPGWKV